MSSVPSPASNANWVSLLGEHPKALGQTLPIADFLAPLFPDGALRRGSTVSITGSVALAFEVVGRATESGNWCAAVGLRELGCRAASEAGVELARFPLIRSPARKWSVVVAALLDGFDLVLVATPADLHPSDARRLSARVRQRRSVLVSVGPWPQADIHLHAELTEWSGLGEGYGHLTARQVKVSTEGRGAASRRRQAVVSTDVAVA